jgi:hypothetical protein
MVTMCNSSYISNVTYLYSTFMVTRLTYYNIPVLNASWLPYRLTYYNIPVLRGCAYIPFDIMFYQTSLSPYSSILRVYSRSNKYQCHSLWFYSTGNWNHDLPHWRRPRKPLQVYTRIPFYILNRNYSTLCMFVSYHMKISISPRQFNFVIFQGVFACYSMLIYMVTMKVEYRYVIVC